MIGWIAISVVVLIFFGYLVAGVLPRTFLTLRYNVKQSNDRCIKSVLEVNGKSLVFVPELKWRKFVKQYVISERKDKKQLMLKVDENLSYLVYDVAVFNSRDEVEMVLKVNDFVDCKGYGKIIDLPSETSYVSIQVLKADNQSFSDNLTAKMPKGSVFKFLLVNAFVVIMETVWIKICVSNIFGGIFKESFIIGDSWLSTTLPLVGIVILLNSIITIIALAVRSKKFTVKVKDNA